RSPPMRRDSTPKAPARALRRTLPLLGAFSMDESLSRDRGRLRACCLPIAGEEKAAPFLQAEQGPNEQAPVLAAIEVVLDQPLDGRAIEIIVDARARIEQPAAHIVNAVTLEPTAVGTGEALLHGVGHPLRHDALHRLAQHELAVPCFAEIHLGLVT